MDGMHHHHRHWIHPLLTLGRWGTLISRRLHLVVCQQGAAATYVSILAHGKRHIDVHWLEPLY